VKRRNRFVCRHRRRRWCRLFGRFGGRVRPRTRTMQIGENIYLYYKRGQQTRTGTVVMVFNVFGHRLVQLSDPRLRRI